MSLYANLPINCVPFISNKLARCNLIAVIRLRIVLQCSIYNRLKLTATKCWAQPERDSLRLQSEPPPPHSLLCIVYLLCALRRVLDAAVGTSFHYLWPLSPAPDKTKTRAKELKQKAMELALFVIEKYSALTTRINGYCFGQFYKTIHIIEVYIKYFAKNNHIFKIG